MTLDTEPTSSESFRNRRLRVLSVGDQLAWSASNALTLVASARMLSADEFGQLSAGVVAVLIAIALSRALVTEPLLLRVAKPASAASSGRAGHRDGRNAVFGASLAIGPVISLLPLGIYLFLPGTPITVVSLLVLACLVTLLQDAARFVAIGIGRPDLALISDTSWLLVAVGFLLSTLLESGLDTEGAVLWWTAGASTGLCVGLLLLRCRPDPRAGLTWIRTTWPVGRGLAADALVGVGSANLSMLLLGRVAGSGELAGLRGAYLLLGPMNSLTEGAYIAAIPFLAGRTASGKSILQPTVRLSFVLFVAWLTFSLVLLAVPDSIMADILGATWQASADMVPPLLVASLIGAVAIGAYYGVRGWRGSTGLARTRFMLVPVYVILLPLAATVDGGRSYAVALVGVALLQMVLYWTLFLRLDRTAVDRPE